MITTLELRTNLRQIAASYKAQEAQITRLQARISELEEKKICLLKAVTLIDKAIEAISAAGIQKLEATVTSGLQLVFEDPELGLRVVKSEGKRGNSYSIEGYKGEIHGEFLETFGGGVANVVAFLLRVIMIKKFQLAKVLVLDESFSNVSREFLPAVSQLLKTLTHDGKFTILAISHQDIITKSADSIYRVTSGPKLLPLSKDDIE